MEIKSESTILNQMFMGLSTLQEPWITSVPAEISVHVRKSVYTPPSYVSAKLQIFKSEPVFPTLF